MNPACTKRPMHGYLENEASAHEPLGGDESLQ